MGYLRVCPRDLFNEAKLLKCLGQISLLIHDRKILGLNMNHENERDGFDISQNEDDGSIYVSNLHFFDDNGTPVYFMHPLNNKGPYPLMMEYKDELYHVFNDDGTLLISEHHFKVGR